MKETTEKLSAEQFISMKENKSEIRTFKNIGGKAKIKYKIEVPRTLIKAEDLNEKIFVLERLRLEKIVDTPEYPDSLWEGKIEYRFGYYIKGKKSKKGWLWGQFAPMISENDLNRLLELAIKKGTLKGKTTL